MYCVFRLCQINYYHTIYERTDSVHVHNTRGCQLLRVPTGTKTFSNMSARVWNALSNKIDSNTSVFSSI